MKIRPVLTQQSAISVVLALGSTLFLGCEQKLGGVPMNPGMQDARIETSSTAADEQPQLLGGEPPAL